MLVRIKVRNKVRKKFLKESGECFKKVKDDLFHDLIDEVILIINIVYAEEIKAKFYVN